MTGRYADRNTLDNVTGAEARGEVPYFLRGDGEVGRLMQAHDWSASPLGAPATWSPTLQTLVSVMLNCLTPAFVAWGPELALLYNEAYLGILGEKHPAALGSPLPRVWPEIWPEIEPYVTETLAGNPIAFEDRPFTLRRGGKFEATWFSFTYTPVHTPDGKVAGVYCLLHETTAKVLADRRQQEHERSLQASAQRAEEEHQRLHALLQAAPVGISFADAAGRIVISNAGNSRLWGKHPYSLNVDDYLEWKGWWADGSARHGERVQPDEWALARALRGEEVVDDLVEIEPFGSAGARKTVLLRAAPVRNGKGDIINAVVAQIDITDQVRATETARESEAKFRTIADVMPQMVWSTDAHGHYDYCNERMCRFAGGPPDGATDGDWVRMLHPDDQARAREHWQHSLDTGEPYEIEYRMRDHSGEYRWVLARALPLRDRTGKVARWMGTSTDIEERKRTEAVLLDARLRLEATLTAADLGTWTWDIRHDKVYADRNVARLFGLSEAEANGGPVDVFLARLHPDDALPGAERIRASIATDGRYRATYRVRRQDGSYRHILARGKVEYDKDGAPAWLPGIALDITQQKQAEEALARSEAKFRRLVEAGVIGIVHYRLDGTLQEANDAFLEIVGYTREEFERGGLSWQELTAPEWQERNATALAQLRSSGRMENFIKEYIRKDGSRATVYVGAAAFEASTEEGIAYILDISGLKEAERSLKESEARFRAITDAMPQMVWSARADGYLDYCNQRWYDFTGMPEGSTDGDVWNGLSHPDDQERVLARWRHCLATGEPYEIEYRLRHRSGQYRWVLARALPIPGDSGRIARWMGTFTDVHEQRLTQEALRDSDRRKDEFLAMLAHELRNPLAPISAAAELLAMTPGTDARLQHISNVIARQANHMTGLVGDLLDVSRVTRGRVVLHKEAVDIKAVTAEAIEQVRPLVEERNHALETHLPLENATVLGDRKRLVQVLANLLGNAARYTPSGGRIDVLLRVDAERVTLSVRDNGIGMSPELVQRAFELFAQGERSADRGQGGLGIGLALVKSLLELHDGSVAAHSPGTGMGSEFTVSLPRLVQAEERDRQDGAQAAPLRATDACRVLLVDDNADAADMLALSLGTAGYEVAVEYHPADALRRAPAFSPHVCLLDIGLPEIDGYELARRFRSLPGMEDARLVAVSGYGQPQDKELALAAGFEHHLVKPVATAELVGLLNRITEASD